MNDVRRRALITGLISGSVLAAAFRYLLSIDYGGRTMPAHGVPFLVALLTPSVFLFFRSAAMLILGRQLPLGWPYRVEDPSADRRPFIKRMWSRPES